MKTISPFSQTIFPLPTLVNLALLMPLFICVAGNLIQYYRHNSSRTQMIHTLEEMNRRGIRFIVHAEDNVFKLKNVKLEYPGIVGEKETLNAEWLEFHDPNAGDHSALSDLKKSTGHRELQAC